MKNEKGGHMMEVAGVDGFTARGCVFKDQVLPVGEVGYEAIQFDILHPSHMVNCRVEDLNMRNILVENCTFENIPRGVGTHTGVLNKDNRDRLGRNLCYRFVGKYQIAVQGGCR